MPRPAAADAALRQPTGRGLHPQGSSNMGFSRESPKKRRLRLATGSGPGGRFHGVFRRTACCPSGGHCRRSYFISAVQQRAQRGRGRLEIGYLWPPLATSDRRYERDHGGGRLEDPGLAHCVGEVDVGFLRVNPLDWRARGQKEAIEYAGPSGRQALPGMYHPARDMTAAR